MSQQPAGHAPACYINSLPQFISDCTYLDWHL